MNSLRHNNDSQCDIVLINPPHHRRVGSGVIFPLGLGYLKSFLEDKGFKATIIDCALYYHSLTDIALTNFKRWLINKLIEAAPQFAIGVGPCSTPTVKALHLIAEVCTYIYPELPLIYGGPLASIPNQSWLFFEKLNASYIIPGDGEYVITELIEAIALKKTTGNIIGLIDSKENIPNKPNFIKNLDALPFPFRPTGKEAEQYKPSLRRDLFVYPVAHIITSRGCPFACKFCLSGSLRKGNYIRRSWENIQSEIELMGRNGARSIIFYDDAFFPSASSLESDIRALSNIFTRNSHGIVWQCEMHPNVFLSLTDNLVERLFESGCRQINIGIETSMQQTNRQLGKVINHDAIRQKCNLVLNKAPQLRLAATFIIGGPGESEKDVLNTINYASSLPLLFAHFYPLKVYPGTEFYAEVYGSENFTGWYHDVMFDELPWGEILYCKGKQKDKIFDTICRAYSNFYFRPEWKKLAKSYLADKYIEVERQVSNWSIDRFSFRR